MLETLNALQQTLEPLSASDRLQYIHQQYGSKAVFSTSLGPEDQVITHYLAKQNLSIPLFSLDTGRLFEETYALYDRTIARYRIPIRLYFPDATEIQALVDQQGINGFYESIENRKACCRIRKINPLKKALQGAQVWITGLRASQSANRGQLPMVEWDEANQIIKVHPLLDWSDEALNQFIDQENIPVNPLHQKGFTSIGCAPCTRAIEPGEDPRAGRWWWEQSAKECGLHAS